MSRVLASKSRREAAVSAATEATWLLLATVSYVFYEGAHLRRNPPPVQSSSRASISRCARALTIASWQASRCVSSPGCVTCLGRCSSSLWFGGELLRELARRRAGRAPPARCAEVQRTITSRTRSAVSARSRRLRAIGPFAREHHTSSSNVIAASIVMSSVPRELDRSSQSTASPSVARARLETDRRTQPEARRFVRSSARP